MSSATPKVLPSMQEWKGRSGQCLIMPTSRLIIEARSPELVALANLFQVRLQRVTGIVLTLVIAKAPAMGDICLTLTNTDLGQDGYLLDIAHYVTLRAETTTGLFYGTQTLLQMLLQSPVRCTLPYGSARDYPSFAHRSVMLDLGRRYWSLDALFEVIERMAWLKLNMLHLHFTEWSAFRLHSKQYVGLAAEESYSRSEINVLQAFAKAYHVTIIPEIDLPAHATAITRYLPDLKLDCPSMSYSRWAGGEQGGWTINYASADARARMRDLLTVFIDWFDGPYFHIGTDEVPEGTDLSDCGILMEYARQHGYAHAGDVLVDWINEVNALVKSHGKQLQIWNWWERSRHSIHPDDDILINVWVEKGDATHFLNAGYQVINSPEDTHYVTPGIGLLPNPNYLYDQWKPNPHPNMLGYKLCVWADQAEYQTDAFFEAHMSLPRAILAERTWNAAPPSVPLAAFTESFETFNNALPLINIQHDRRVREILGLESPIRTGKV